MTRLARWVKQEGRDMGHLANFHHRISGPDSAPKLVFLHGLMGSAANWRKIVPAFEDQYNVLVFDQRGHGKSFHPDFGFSPEAYARDLQLILDELGWTEGIYLVGHSLGGRNALQFAHSFASRVKKLVIEDIGPDSPPEAVEKIEFYLNSIPTPFRDKKAAKVFFDQEFPQKIGKGKEGEVLSQYFYTNIQTQQDGTADWRFSRKAILGSVKEGRAYERWDQVRSLRTPTLWIRGSQSEDLSSGTFQRVLEISPYIRGVEIAGAGHWVHFDQPALFIQSIKDFFVQDKST